MATHRPNPRLVKIHRSYSVEEAARLLDTHKNTIRGWIKQGLHLLDTSRPALIHGMVLRDFIQAKRIKNKRPCKPDELYCLRCRAPKRPAANMAEFKALTEKLGNLIAICPDCNALMNKRVNITKASMIAAIFDIRFTKSHEHIRDMAEPSLNSDFKQETDNHEKASS